MTLDDFKALYQGFFVYLPANEGQSWRHFQELSDYSFFVTNYYLDALYSVIKNESELEGEHEETTLTAVLMGVNERCIVINVNELTQAKWDTLLELKNWDDSEAYCFWDKLTDGRTFLARARGLGLSNNAMIGEVFGLSPADCKKWGEHNAPPQVLIQVALLEAKIELKAEELAEHCMQSVECFHAIGIPIYSSMEDYHACDQDTARELPFLPLYHALVDATIAYLFGRDICAVPVNTSFNGYRKWLNKNRYPAIIGSLLLFATHQVD